MGEDPRGPEPEPLPSADGVPPSGSARPSTVLVTGASSGIGRAIVHRLTHHGLHVLAGVRGEEARVRLEGAERTTPIELDITDPEAVEEGALIAATHDLVGLVNNAGTALLGPLEFLDPERVRDQFEVNVFGHLALTQAVLPLLRETQGRIVNISSISGRVAFPLSGAYAASKFALEAMSDALRRELAPFHVTVSLIEPGNVDTAIWQTSFETQTKAAADFPPEARAYYPQPDEPRNTRGMTSPDQVARIVLKALTSDRPRSRYLVGRDAWVYATLSRLLPDSLLDRMVRP